MFVPPLRMRELADNVEGEGFSPGQWIGYGLLFLLLPPPANSLVSWFLYHTWLLDHATQARQVRALGILAASFQFFAFFGLLCLISRLAG